MTSDDPKWEEQWDEGFAYLKELHQYMYTSGGSIVYPNKNQGTLDLLNQGEIDMCANWADMVLSQRAQGAIKDTIPDRPARPGSDRLAADPVHPDHRLQRRGRICVHELHAVSGSAADHGHRGWRPSR